MKKQIFHFIHKFSAVLLGAVLLSAAAGTAYAGETGTSLLETSEMFTDRDMEQEADLSEAVYLSVQEQPEILITEAGVYVISGVASEAQIRVEASSEDKVQLVLNGLNITNSDSPCIYVASGDKVFVTTISDSSLSVTEAFDTAEDSGANSVIFSRSDLVLNGAARLTLNSTENAVESKDDLKVTGGTYIITAGKKALSANDSIRIADGVFSLNAGTDGLHAENDEDSTLGYIYIGGGDFTINAGDDAIHGESVVQIDQGTFEITAQEGIEGTYIQINGGTIHITGGDDGINAAAKSSAYYPTIEINDGEIIVEMAAGDTDGLDSNGDLYIRGGYIAITGSSAFDYDGYGEFSGGTLMVNGEQVYELTGQMMGGSRGGRGR